MFEKLRATLTVQESDLPRVQPLLDMLFRVTNVLAVVMIVVALAGIVAVYGSQESTSYHWAEVGLSLLLLAATFGLRRLEQREFVGGAINLLLAAVVLYVTLLTPPGTLTTVPAFIAYALLIVVAAFLLAPAAGLVWAVAASLALLIRALVVAGAPDVTVDPVSLAINIISLHLLALFSWVLGRSFQQAQQDLRRQIVQSRTGVEIGRMVTAALDLPTVTRQTVQMIWEAFGYYHVGLFTVKPQDNVAILMDAAGEGASNLKERGFHVSLAGMSAVAVAINQKQRRVVTTWQESRGPGGKPVEFTHERLPTRVELVIPLLARDRVLGALDVHSTELDAFPEEEVHTLEGLAGNIANALETAYLFDDIQRRHMELTEVYSQTERRASYLEITAELARAISSLRAPQELLDEAVDLISTGFNFYHVGIFLVDEAGEWAILTAANSEGGQRMLARGHRLRVGEQGIVGWVTGTGEARIALDVGEDAVHFVNPDLPDTRSEIALPLRVGGRVIGALDVQSIYEAAFSEEDAAVLQALADQIAIAIENARLFQETQRALEEVQALQRYYVTQQWENLVRQRDDLGAEYRDLGVPPLETTWTPEMEMALTKEIPIALPDLSAVILEGDGRDSTQGDGGEPQLRADLHARSALAVPIRLRGEVIGVLDLQETDRQRYWTEEEVAMATVVADQLALALENARLFEEAQRRLQEQTMLFDASRSLTYAPLRPEDIAEITVRQFVEVMGVLECSLSVLDPQTGVLHTLADFYMDEERGQTSQEQEMQTFALADYPATARVMETLQPLVVQASDPDADPAELAYMREYEVATLVIIPLAVKGQAIGVIELETWDRGQTYTQEQLNLAMTLANQAAVALENARLFSEVERTAWRERRAREIMAKVQTATDVEDVLQIAVRELGRALNAPRAIVQLGKSASQQVGKSANRKAGPENDGDGMAFREE